MSHVVYRYKGDDAEIDGLKLVRNRIYFLHRIESESVGDKVCIFLSNGLESARCEYEEMKNFLGDWMYLGIMG